MCDETTKQFILSAIHKNVGSVSCNSLMDITGYNSNVIFTALESLLDDRLINIRITPIMSNKAGSITRAQSLYSQFLDLLDKHITQERQISYYASKLFITPKYLSVIVKKISGKSANYWINSKLIEIIKFQLVNTSKSIKEIAYALNFSNNSSFGKYFKTQIGISPSEFRANYNKKQ